MANSAVVLVVDDEPLVLMVLAENLRDRGFVVYEAGDAATAVALLETQPDIEVLVTDFKMPGSMNGARLVRVVRRRWPSIKVIVLSGRGLDPQATLPTGTSYFSKPHPIDALAECIAAGRPS